jgi:hypothetical protein
MANESISALESQLGDLEKQTKESYDTLQALYKRLGIAQGTLKKKGLLGGVKEKTTAEIPQIEAAIRTAEEKYNSFQTKKNSINLDIKRAKKSEQKTKLAEATSKSAGNIYDASLEQLKTAELGLNGYGGTTEYQNAYRKAQAAYAAAQKAGLNPASLGEPKIMVPPVEKDGGKKDQTGSTVLTADDLTAFLATIEDPKNTELIQAVQQDLHDIFGYNGPIDGKFSVPFEKAVSDLATRRDALPDAYKGNDFRTFLANKDSAYLLGIKTGGAGGPAAAKPYGTISNKYDAEVTINNAFSGLLKREATSSEISALTKILNDAEKKNLKINKDGIITGGIVPEQFIQDIIKTGTYLNSKKQPVAPNILGKLSEELKTKKQDVRTIAGQDLITTAKANGLTLSQSQLDAYTTAIQNGTKPDIIKNQIRASASMGLPDNVKKMMADGTDLETIYAPYKNVMYQTLELNPDAINLNDPTLRSAIGANGEMPIYDFQRSLRKDPRWQYTNNAREDVSNSVTKVLQDFGFVG